MCPSRTIILGVTTLMPSKLSGSVLIDYLDWKSIKCLGSQGNYSFMVKWDVEGDETKMSLDKIRMEDKTTLTRKTLPNVS